MPPVDRVVEKQSEVTQFASAAFYVGIEKPVNGLLQTVERASTVKLPRMELVDGHGADGPNATSAQKLGALLGSVVDYGTARVASHYGLSKTSVSFLKAGPTAGALSGAMMGGIFTPVDDKDNFWQKKAGLAVTEAAAFATMEGAANGLKQVKPLAVVKEDSFLKSVGKGSVRGSVSGAAAGFVMAEGQSLNDNHEFAGGDLVKSSMLHYAEFGAVLGAASGGAEKFTRAETSESKVDDPNRIISFDRKGFIGGEDEGRVYSNGDGSVTKVFNKKDVDPMHVKAVFDGLKALKISTPEINEIGKTEEGYPAIRMQQIGNGDHLKQQLIEGQVSGNARDKLIDQYYGAAMALNKAGLRIDWQLKNMAWQDGKLYVLDPGFLLNDEPQYQPMVDAFGNLVGPRPAKYSYQVDGPIGGR